MGDGVGSVAPYEGVQSRPGSLDLFLSNWAQNATVVSVTQPLRLRFLFAYDVTGALIRAHLVDHAWCAVGRDVSTFPRSRPIWQLLREREREKWLRCLVWKMDGWMDGWNCRDVEWLKRCRI